MTAVKGQETDSTMLLLVKEKMSEDVCKQKNLWQDGLRIAFVFIRVLILVQLKKKET